MRQVRLSICIPTYNFGAFIGRTLESIESQSSDEIEIVIVDGASSDNTPQIVGQFHKRFARLNYHRRTSNMGLDRDLAKAVELAQGDYCWLLSSDDALNDGAIVRILREINYGHDIYLCNRIRCDGDLRPKSEQTWLSKKHGDGVFDLSETHELLDYLQRAESIGALFSYMSVIVFKRARWLEVARKDAFIGTNYAHVWRLFSVARHGGSLKYIRDALVSCRGGNDSFLVKGRINRFVLDISGYEQIAADLFPDVELRNAFKTVMQREHRWYKWIRVRHETSPIQWNDLEQRLKLFGYARWKLLIARSLGASGALVSTIMFARNLVGRGTSLFYRPGKDKSSAEQHGRLR